MKPETQGIQPRGEPAKSKRRVFAALVVSTALVAASCGGSETAADAGTDPAPNSSPSPSADDGSGAESPGESSFPAVEVLSLNDSQNVKFDEFLSGGDTPVLLWFYFPH